MGGLDYGALSMSWIFSGFVVGMSRVWLTAGLVFSLTVALLMGSAAPAGAVAGYGDVAESSWYTNPVQWSVDNAITDIAGACFAPDTPVSRGETAVWIYNMENQPNAGEPHSFTDVTDASQDDAISWMANTGITTGTSPTTFAPDDTLRRAQVAAFLHRLADEPSAPPHSFVDVVASWQQDPVSWMSHTGITTGTSPTTFAPEDTLTRAQLITFLYRYKGEPDVTVNTSTPHCDPTTNVVEDPAAGTEQTSDSAILLNSAMDGGGIIAAGSRGWCVIRTDNTMACWDIAGLIDARTPSGQFTAVSVGHGHSCAIRSDRTVTCWGSNGSGQADAPTGQFAAVSAGDDHSCGLRADRTLTCWGRNGYGVLDAPTGQFAAVSARDDHSCGLRADKTLTCWGRNYDRWGAQATIAPSGQFISVSVGLGSSCAVRTSGDIECWGSTWPDLGGPLELPSGQFTAVSLSSDGSYACAVRADGTTACWWGQNYLGQGDAPSGEYLAVSVGQEFSCAVSTDGGITCWGTVTAPLGESVIANDVGQPGGPDDAVTPGGEIISAGYNHSCGLLADRTVACWGHHNKRQQNFAASDRRLGSDQVREVSGMEFVAVSAGSNFASSNSCGLLADLTLTCSGKHNPGQYNLTPGGRFLAVSSGGSHSCGLLANQTVTCWGYHQSDQLEVPAGRFLAVSSGGSHSCGLLADQTVTCWTSQSPTPNPNVVEVPAGQFLAVSAGYRHSCGLRADETIVCWGSDLSWDNATQQDYHDARTSPPAGRFLAVSAGNGHSCGLRVDQTVTCWGNNEDGQHDAPTGRFRAVSAGFAHSCGLRVDQTVTCWGGNQFGEADAPRLRFFDQADTSASTSTLIPAVVECQQPTSSVGKPGPPAGLDVFIRVLNSSGYLGVPAAVGWATPCQGGPVDHYVVQWRRGGEDFSTNSQHVVQSADTAQAYSFEIPELRVYAVRVTAVNSYGQSHSTEVKVPTPNNEVRDFLERTVRTHEDRYPWMSEVWTHINTPDFVTTDRPCGSGTGFQPVGCASSGFISLVDFRGREDLESTAVHEMAHVYHDLTDLAANPAAIAVGSMYLKDFIKDSDGTCPIQELYADIPGILMEADGIGFFTSAYWSHCYSSQKGDWGWPRISDRWPELLAVMRSVYVDLEVPQWFYDNYQLADGNWDVEAIKAALGFYDLETSTYRQLSHLIPEFAIEVEVDEEEDTSSTEIPNPPDISGLIANGTYGSYSLDFLQELYNRPDRCWITINNYVYDVTPGDEGYNYPGPGQITDLCGQDASVHFSSNNLGYPPIRYLKGYLRSR